MRLAERLAAVIAAEGPIAISRYMDLCLHDPDDGYYATRPSLGAAGDFITAPHVSQMFGELLGLWAAEVWSRLGKPARVRLVELGPGDGTLMTDVLRAARAAPGFLAACEVILVETSAPLREVQRRALAAATVPVSWSDDIEALPAEAPLIILANEFLDCLPIGQAILTEDGWRERRIGLSASGKLEFQSGATLPPLHGEGKAAQRPGWGTFAPPADRRGDLERPTLTASPSVPPHEGEGGVGSVLEYSPALSAMGRGVGALITRAAGAAVFIDYGHATPGIGDTLQAVRCHRKEGPLDNPGAADLTAHVDFPAFIAAAAAAGASVAPIQTQGDFLRRLGIETRADALIAARPDRADVIRHQLRRLIDPARMGTLFKVACIGAPGLTLPGCESRA